MVLRKDVAMESVLTLDAHITSESCARDLCGALGDGGLVETCPFVSIWLSYYCSTKWRFKSQTIIVTGASVR